MIKSYQTFFEDQQKDFPYDLLYAVIKYVYIANKKTKGEILSHHIPEKYRQFSGPIYRAIYLERKEYEKLKKDKRLVISDHEGKILSYTSSLIYAIDRGY